MTKKQTTAAIANIHETTFLTPAEHAAQAGFTNWATITMQGETKMLLTTASGDTDTLDTYSDRTENVLAAYEAVYTTDLNTPPHPKITLCAILTEGANHE